MRWTFVQLSVPSLFSMPSGLPPFLVKYLVTSFVISWKMIVGAIPETCLINWTSSLYIWIISSVRARSFLTVRVQNDCLDVIQISSGILASS
jgi:hypothetical protein